MTDLNIYSFSKSNVPRYIVIDHSVLLEEIVTETIGRLLNIDWKTSTILGNSNGALSFKHKFELIQEKIDEYPQAKQKKVIKKFTLFSTIRNKFAHVREIEKWGDFFKKYPQYSNDLKDWYKEHGSYDDSEDSFQLLYYYLTHELFYYLIQKNLEWVFESGKLEGSNKIRTELLNFITKKASESSEVSQLWNEFTSQLQNKE